MKGTYKRELNYSYLVLEEQSMSSTQYYQMKMVTENQINHLLKVSVHNFNGENRFYYDISGKQTLACIFEKKEMEADQLISILSGLSKVLVELENFFLEENYLCLDPEYVYMNVNTKQLFLCFYPFEERDFSLGIRQLAEYLLNLINHQDEKAVAVGYQFYRLTREDNFILGHILEEISEEYTITEREIEEFGQVNNNEKSTYEEDIHKETAYQTYPGRAYTHREAECEEAYFYEEEQEKSRKSGSASIKEFKIFALTFLLLILAGIGYGIYQYWNRQGAVPFSLGEFLGARDMILAAGAVIVGFAGFLLLFLYKKILEGAKETEERKEGSVPQEEYEYFESNDKAYEKESEPIEQWDEWKESSKCQETVLLKENTYNEERILIEKLKRFEKRQPEKIILDHFPFIIGKLEKAADYVILDKSVSRMHAKFIKRDGENMVYVMDLNSKNGTLKNGIPLEVNELVPLTAEDEITFGKVTFTYH